MAIHLLPTKKKLIITINIPEHSQMHQKHLNSINRQNVVHGYAVVADGE